MFSDIESRLSAIDPLIAIVEISTLVFLLVMVSETLWDRFAGYRHTLAETGANMAIGLIYSLLDRTIYGVFLVAAVFLTEPFALFDIPIAWWSWCVAILAADFTYYWMHRCEHRVRLLWTYHSVHHSSPEFNFSTALRLAWLEALFEWPFLLPMVILGFDPIQVIGGLIVVVAYQSWIHTEKIGQIGWLDRFLNTPSNHRVHHASDAEHLDKNYGGILIVWDRLFGTYAPETNPVSYGITEPLGSSNPLKINFHAILKLSRDMRTSTSLMTALKVMVKPPGWHPKD